MIIDQAKLDERMTTINAIFGSLEKMTQHPLYVECVGKLQDVQLLQMKSRETRAYYNRTRSKWNPFSFIVWQFVKLAYRRLDTGLEDVEKSYRIVMGLPTGFGLAAANEKYAQLHVEQHNVITVVVKTFEKTLKCKEF